MIRYTIHRTLQPLDISTVRAIMLSLLAATLISPAIMEAEIEILRRNRERERERERETGYTENSVSACIKAQLARLNLM